MAPDNSPNNPRYSSGGYEAWEQDWAQLTKEGAAESARQLYTSRRPNTLVEFWQKSYALDLHDLIADRDYQTFLELGAGRGTTSMYLSSWGHSDITMVDLSTSGFEIAKRNFEKEQLPLPKMIIADVEDTGLEKEQFDCIYNVGLLEHFTDPSKALREAYRLLRPGGLIFMPIVPTLPAYKSMIASLLFNPFRILYLMSKKYVVTVPTDETILRVDSSRVDYVTVARRVGFGSASCVPYNPYHNVLSGNPKEIRNYEKYFILPLYTLHRNIKRLFIKRPSLQTVPIFESCYLLYAYK